MLFCPLLNPQPCPVPPAPLQSKASLVSSLVGVLSLGHRLFLQVLVLLTPLSADILYCKEANLTFIPAGFDHYNKVKPCTRVCFWMVLRPCFCLVFNELFTLHYQLRETPD